MLEIAEQIFRSNTVRDAQGREYPLHSHTSREQCEFLQRIVVDMDARRCLEVGLAYGLSSLFVCEAIFGKDGSVFYSIDPKQDAWKNVGLRNLEVAGFRSLVRFYRDASHNVLPKLLAEGVRLDFAYVDSTKIFDVLLVDTYYLSLLLREGGVLVLDDCILPSVRRLARYVSKLPHWKVYDSFGRFDSRFTVALLSRLSKPLPHRDRIISDELVTPASELGIHAHCVAFQKTGEDARPWDWYEPF
jgi:predicted O-methyltransferase YrrM